MGYLSLLKRQKRSDRFYLKTISAMLLLAFAFQEISFARADLSPIEWDPENQISKFWAKQILPLLPESVVSIEDAHHATGSDKTLILIQDAHTNTSGQLNVSKTLDCLLKQEEKIKYVFLEAGSGNESLSFLRKYSSLEKRKQVAKSYLMKGQLQGSEYLDLTSDKRFTLWGVEDMDLYAKSLEIYRAIAKDREKFREYLARVEATVKALKPKVLNPFLLAFDQKRLAENHTVSGTFELLIDEAKKLGVPIRGYPNLATLARLKKIESRIDFKKASEEEAKAVLALKLDAPGQIDRAGGRRVGPDVPVPTGVVRIVWAHG